MPGESIVETSGSSAVMASQSHPMPGKSIVETSGSSAVMRFPKRRWSPQCLIHTEKDIEGFCDTIEESAFTVIVPMSPLLPSFFVSIPVTHFLLLSSFKLSLDWLSDSLRTQNRIINRSYVGPIFTVPVPIVLQRVKKVVKRPKSNSPCQASSLDHSSSLSSSLILISTSIAL